MAKNLVSSFALTIALAACGASFAAQAENAYVATKASTKRKTLSVDYTCSMTETLVKAYQNNPELQEALRTYYAAVEDIPAARAGWLPNISLIGSAEHSKTHSDGRGLGSPNLRGRSNQNSDTLSARMSVEQNIFNGFGTTRNLEAARASVMAAQMAYVDTEQTILLKAITAYLDLWRATRTLELRKASVGFRRRVLEQVRAQESVGDKNRTDVAEARSRVSAAIADKLSAEAQLAASQATYRQITGSEILPAVLKKPDCMMDKDMMPKDLADYTAQALKGFPLLRRAEFIEKAQVAAEGVAKAALLPDVNLTASAGRTKTNSQSNAIINNTGFSYNNNATFGVQMRIPLYSGGKNWSGLRRAKQDRYKARNSLQRSRLEILQAVEANWQAVISNKGSVQQFKNQVNSARLTLEGRRQEYNVGERTLTDTLDQEQQLVTAQVQLVGKQRDYILSQFTTLRFVGKLLPSELNLPVVRHDYHGYTSKTSGKIGGLGDLRIPASIKG